MEIQVASQMISSLIVEMSFLFSIVNDKINKRKFSSSQLQYAIFTCTVSSYIVYKRRHFEFNLFRFWIVNYLEKQLQRAIMLNPALADDLNNRKEDAPAANDDKAIDEPSHPKYTIG